MWIRPIHIAYLKNNIENKKIKTRSELTTLSLSVVIIVLEISHKLHDDDTGNNHYDDKTAILLFLRVLNFFLDNFDCFSILLLTTWNYSLLFQAGRFIGLQLPRYHGYDNN